jgi:hypothetical protein
VSPTPDRQFDTVVGGEAHGAHDVVDRCGPRDDRRPLGDHPVPQRHRLRVSLVIGTQEGSVEIRTEGIQGRRVQLGAAVKAGDRD